MKRKILSMVLCTSMVFSLAACGKTKEAPSKGKEESKTEKTTEATTEGKEESKKETKKDKNADVTLRIVGYSSQEADLNIIRDQLNKAGFTVELNTQPDYSSYKTVVDSGAWDLAMSGWTTVTGNPDYAVRDIMASYGANNEGGINDQKVDELIDKAASETPAEYQATYKELEDYAITEHAYLLPVYALKGTRAINKTVVDENTVRNPQSRSGVWENYSYVDPSLNETRTLMLASTQSTLTSLDPIQANDGSVNQLSSNINVRIVNLEDDDTVTADGSLSLTYAIAEGNSDYYFILRDDVYFSKVEDKHVVATGVRVGAEDVQFSLTRAADQKSVALHKTYNLHNHMKEISIVEDLDELKNVKDSDSGKPIIETLSVGLDKEVTALTADKTKADNANGVYQVVKVTTNEPFPQVLNYLAHQSAGILNKEAVTEMNSKFDVETYDATKDVCYGDAANIKSGNNHLWMSGPYALVSYDDYQVVFEKNPGYMAGTEHEAKISNLAIKFVKDATAQTSSFRANEIDILDFVNTNDVATLEGNEDYKVYKYVRHAANFAKFNMKNDNIFASENLRKAVFNAINQEEFIAYHNGIVIPLYSPFSTIIQTGNEHKQDLEKSAEYLDAYLNEA